MIIWPPAGQPARIAAAEGSSAGRSIIRIHSVAVAVMRFESLPIADALLLHLDPHADDRGFFARIFCAQEFSRQGRSFAVVQASVSFNHRSGTLRGMHFQWPPSRESKLVRCVRGRLVDVLLDLRPDAPTYLRHVSVPLDAEGRTAVLVPHGVAHGFQTLVDETEVLYMMDDFYAPQLQGGVRWDDPRFAIRWPLPAPIMSGRDRELPLFERATFEAELRRRRATLAAGSHGQ